MGWTEEQIAEIHNSAADLLRKSQQAQLGLQKAFLSGVDSCEFDRQSEELYKAIYGSEEPNGEPAHSGGSQASVGPVAESHEVETPPS